MKTLLAILLLVGSALANSISTIPLTGIGSGEGSGDFWSSAQHPNFYLALGVESESTFTGGLSVAMGQAEYRMALPTATLAGSVLSGDFTGFEYLRLGPQDWVYYAIAGTFEEGVSFSAADQHGTVDIAQSTLLGRFAMAPEPPGIVFLVTGIMGIGGLCRKHVRT